MIVICLCVARKMAECDITNSSNNSSNVRSRTYPRNFEHMRTDALDTTSSIHWALAFFAALLRVETQPSEEEKKADRLCSLHPSLPPNYSVFLFFISGSLVLVGGIMSLKVNWIIKCVNLVLNLRACFSCHDAFHSHSSTCSGALFAFCIFSGRPFFYKKNKLESNSLTPEWWRPQIHNSCKWNDTRALRYLHPSELFQLNQQCVVYAGQTLSIGLSVSRMGSVRVAFIRKHKNEEKTKQTRNYSYYCRR